MLIIALRPGGPVTEYLNKSMDKAFDAIDDMAKGECLAGEKVNGKWTAWTKSGVCEASGDGTSCSQTYVRNCVGQKCNGADCSGLDGGNAVKQEPCYEDGAWVAGAWGACKGSCGTMKGKQDGVVTCDGACCDPTTKSLVSTTQSCDLSYGNWQTGAWGDCQVSCGTGTQVRTLGCSDLINNCCDPATKSNYPTSQSCTNGCCARTLVVGYNDQTGKDITAEFPRANDGDTVSLNSTGWFCPAGFSGNPTVTCTGINFGPVNPVNNECVPADCDVNSPNRTQNICDTSKAPGCSLTVTFPDTQNSQWATIYCTDQTYKQGNGAGYTGTATMQCDHGAWDTATLAAGCIPNCPADPINIGLGLTGPFPETQDPGGLGVPVSYDCKVSPYTQGQACGDARYVGTPSRTCNAGTWSGLSGSCDYKSCDGVGGTFCNASICWTFTGDSSNTHGTSKTLVCKTDVNGLYEGEVSATCDYGKWCPPTSGDCVAASCSAWTTAITADDGNPVDVTFAGGTSSGTTVYGTEQDPLHKCNVRSQCCYGIWVDPAIDCSTVNISTPKSYSSDCTCWAVKCRDNAFTTPVANATKCSSSSGDPFDEMVTDDTDWSIVPADNISGGGCTTTKCEYKCTDGYKLIGYACVAAECTPVGSNPDPNGLASMCPGDGSPLVDTAKTLVASLADCGAPKCEYYCGGSYQYCSSTTRCYTPLTCSSYSLCNGGSLSRSNGCSMSLNCKSCDCTSPCGNGTILNGNPDTCYSANPVACGILCSSVSQTAICNSGSWSSPSFASTYTNQTCSVTACQDCTNTPDGSTILHGEFKTYYSFNQSNCSCLSEDRTCYDGTLAGGYTGTTCSGIPCCGDTSCYGPPDYCIGCSCSYMESCKTCSTDCACTTRSFTVAVNAGTQGRTYTSYGFPSTQSENGCCSITSTTLSCNPWGCYCEALWDGYYSYYYATWCYVYNQTTVNSSTSLCSTYAYMCSTITSTGVTGVGCGNPGTPGNSCAVTLSE